MSTGGAIALSLVGLMASSLGIVLGLPDPGLHSERGLAHLSPVGGHPQEQVASSAVRSVPGEFSVLIVSSSALGEVGQSTSFAASVLGGQSPYNFTWADAQGDGSLSSTWTVIPRSAGNLTLTLEVRDALGELAAASYLLPVAGTITLTFPGPANATDLGLPLKVVIEVAGGVSPFDLTFWLPGGASQSGVLLLPGPFELLVTPTVEGPAYLSVNATDALGDLARAVMLVATVAAPLTVQWDDVVGTVDSEEMVTVRADASGGTPPLTWSMVAAGPLALGSPSAGTVESPGAIQWSGAFAAPGNATLALYVSDARGAVVSARLTLEVQPPMALLGPGVPSAVLLGSAIRLNLTILGGTPPYQVQGSASDGEAAVTDLAAGAGNLTWTLEPAAAGPLSVSLRVTDAAQASLTSNWTVEVTELPSTVSPDPISPPRSDASPVPAVLGASGLFGALVLGIALWWKRRRPTPAPTTGSPVDTSDVQRLLSEGEGIERETLYLLGEEQGLLRSAVAAQLKEARRTGQVSVERAVTGEEVFRWVGPPGEGAGSEVAA